MNRGVLPEPLARLPWRIILPLLVLTGFGSTVLYSAAGGSLRPWALTHIVRFFPFLGMAILLSRVPKRLFKQAAYPVYGLIVVLLVLVELIGGIGGGSQRWLNLGFMTLQPSELMKPGIVLVMARFYDDLPASMSAGWRALLPAAALLALPAGLVIIQPDLGTGLAITFGATVVVFLAGVPIWWFLAAGGAMAVIAPLAFFTLLHDYQRQRVFVFLDPAADPLGTGYHILQSTIAIGSGGLFGKGFGNGSQSHLDYLPEAHTDFVFATMAEEWGMIGGLFVIGSFAWLLVWGWRTARGSSDRFAQLLAGGMTFTVFFYVCINLMMVMGLAPVVGIPLPFLSHGGSSMMTNMICIGTIMAVANWNRGGSSSLS